MGLFNDIIRDARRTVRSSGQVIQRMTDDAAPAVSVGALPPAPPMEEQADGALTVYRFQKEGQVVPREVPNHVETGGRQRQHVDPSVGRSRESKERVTQSIDNAFVLDDLSVTASSRKNSLVTGKGDTAHTERQDSTVSEASSIGLLRQQVISDDLSSVESPPGQYGPVDTFSGDSLQWETGERELSRDAGPGTPSEPLSIRWTAADDELPDTMAYEPTVNVTNSLEQHESSEEQQGKPGAVAKPRPEMQQRERNAKQFPRSPSRQIETNEPALINTPEKSRKVIDREQVEPSVNIGQVDVVVVSNAPPSKVSAPSANTSRGMASRRYWRRL